MKIGIGADHGGFDLKGELISFLRSQGHEVVDFGADRYEAEDDYPDRTLPVAQAVASCEVERGIVICGSGVGAAVAANKVAGVRASVCHDTYSARQGVEHDDMNVLCLGERVIGIELAREVLTSFMQARFDGAERHLRRLRKVEAIERETMKGGQAGHG